MHTSNGDEHRERARHHAIRRAWQRHGLAVALPDLRAAEKQIWEGRAEWVEDQIKMRSVYRTDIKGKPVSVIFDIHLDAIVTVLPGAGIPRVKRLRMKAA